jgi:hypothetical protein
MECMALFVQGKARTERRWRSKHAVLTISKATHRPE